MLKLQGSVPVLFVAMLILVSCQNQSYFDRVSPIPSDGWPSTKPVLFEFAISDTAINYDMLFHIRNQQDYAYSNIWMFVEITAPNGFVKRDTFEILLADETGRWYGMGIGSINSMLVPYKDEMVFPLRGIYKLTLQQAMYDKQLENIIDVGLRIQPHQPE